jgi:hypothetical protein
MLWGLVRCKIWQLDWFEVRLGTVTVICVSLQPVMAAGCPPMVTLETAVQAPPTLVHWLPKP